MNRTCEKIALLISSGKSDRELESLIHAVTKHGNIEAAHFLLPLFIQTKDSRLLLPIQVYGDAQMADEIFAVAIKEGALKEDYPYETLIALSYLQHAPTEAVLMNYFKGIFEKKLPWDLHVSVCLSLLNYTCHGYESFLKEEIEKCLQEWLFPEMIPALAVKTGDNSLAEKLYQHGCTKASSDASAGLILGIALFGNKSRELFQKIIFNPEWEAASTSTGNARYTLMGMSFLNITFAQLFDNIKALAHAEKENLHQHLFLLSNLLQQKIIQPPVYGVRAIPLHAEPAVQIYQTLFEPEDNNSVFEVLNHYVSEQWVKDELAKEFNQLEALYRLLAKHEAEINYGYNK